MLKVVNITRGTSREEISRKIEELGIEFAEKYKDKKRMAILVSKSLPFCLIGGI